MNGLALALFALAAVFIAMAIGFGVTHFKKDTFVTPTVPAKRDNGFSLNKASVVIPYGFNVAMLNVTCNGPEPTINGQETWMGLSFRKLHGDLYRLEGYPLDTFTRTVMVGQEELEIESLPERYFHCADVTLCVDRSYRVYPHGLCDPFTSPIPGMQWSVPDACLKGTPTMPGTYNIHGTVITVEDELEDSGSDQHASLNTTLEVGMGESVHHRYPVGAEILRGDTKNNSFTILKNGNLIGTPGVKGDHLICLKYGQTFHHLRVRVVARLKWEEKVGSITVPGEGTLVCDDLPAGMVQVGNSIHGKPERRARFKAKFYTKDGTLSVSTIDVEGYENGGYLVPFIVTLIIGVAFLIAGFYTSIRKITK